ncbi:Cof-type HAD-IIB family hydrolase [Geobacillus zalihae]|uniref:Cof-type HAD-IIB family hydrolase n=1 Tax=Geobacillus zalihae TaxID=213419 RepID=A0A1V9CS65_9BACL|nr:MULTISPECIES: Cof-type HAD-IIB family hydrolase [Geobacillus]AGE21134.1 SigE-dependent sporulation HAD hydrolase [Geobacillus sp. GHH01]OQP16529.1 haloacid dehalogenase [Geobacillus zalihae]OQP24386.1 haloacid dehalogenase [Geobacillus zalihae]QNU17938.1 Cof-type HAD-IIB family hydrolase [Geobacillus zalihae]QNU24116.1 Cof-type HAD-IIB family hydrolase [Geobacillus zalihae]
MYKLLALNIDGTILKNNGRLPRETKEAVDYVKKKGVYVTLITSRNLLSARKVAKALRLDGMLIAFQGAMIARTLDDRLFDAVIPEERTFNIVQILENFNCNIRLMHERYSLGNRKKVKKNLVVQTVLSSSDPFFYPTQFVDSLGDVLMDEPIAVPKIDVYFATDEERDAAAALLTKSIPSIDMIMQPNGKMEIVPQGVSKLAGLRRLAQHIGVSLKETVMIGDGLDDLPAIEAAGLGVAMGNAPLEVKRAADWVTRSNEQLGVAYMVKEHFRKQQRIEFLQKLKTKQ